MAHHSAAFHIALCGLVNTAASIESTFRSRVDSGVVGTVRMEHGVEKDAPDETFTSTFLLSDSGGNDASVSKYGECDAVVCWVRA